VDAAKDPNIIISRDAGRVSVRAGQSPESSVLLPFDLVRKSWTLFNSALNCTPSTLYRLLTRMPLQYNVAPSALRSWFLHARLPSYNPSLHISNETNLKILIQALDSLGFQMVSKRPPALIVTHDVDTKKGLKRTLAMKSVDDDLELQSIWFLPSDEYPLDKNIIKDLVNGSTIGSHDVKHDGRLINIKKRAALVKRLRESKLKIEAATESEVSCFRSPLLQFNGRIVAALKEAGYSDDFSAPSWEPAHPSVMTGFGVEFFHEFEISGISLHPLSLLQDHQTLHILDLTLGEGVKVWLEHARLISSYRGDIVLLVHPDYDFAKDLHLYRQLLSDLKEIHGDGQNCSS
jgi:hypothetical protein